MLLSVNQGVPASTINLSWNAYQDSTSGIVPDYYIIYRGSTPDILDSIASKPAISGQEYYSWSDLNITSLYYYQVGIRMPYSCTATGESKEMTGPFSQSLSNIEDNLFDVYVSHLNISDLDLYPNPTTNKVYIKSEKIIQFKVYNLIGDILLICNSKDCSYIELPEKGIYLVEIFNEKDRVYKKIVVH